MALLYGGRKHVEHGSMQPRRSSAQRLSHTQSPPGSAAHSPEQHRSRRNAGWISLGACLVVAWGAPADTAHPLAPPRAHDWRAPRHVPSHPPPWQKGPGLRRMVGAAESCWFLERVTYSNICMLCYADAIQCCTGPRARHSPMRQMDIPCARV